MSASATHGSHNYATGSATNHNELQLHGERTEQMPTPGKHMHIHILLKLFCLTAELRRQEAVSSKSQIPLR